MSEEAKPAERLGPEPIRKTSGQIWEGKNHPHPPAAESIADCIERGLLTRDVDGNLRAVPRPGPKQLWSHCEPRQPRARRVARDPGGGRGFQRCPGARRRSSGSHGGSEIMNLFAKIRALFSRVPSRQQWAKMSVEERFQWSMCQEWLPVNNQGGADSYTRISVRPSEVTVIRRTPAVIYLVIRGVKFEQAYSHDYPKQ